MTPDEAFILDCVPGHPNIAFACGFSGTEIFSHIRRMLKFLHVINRSRLQERALRGNHAEGAFEANQDKAVRWKPIFIKSICMRNLTIKNSCLT
jgi:hypothetical protein